MPMQHQGRLSLAADRAEGGHRVDDAEVLAT